MKIDILNELFIQKNDIYILECHQGSIIVNNNYSGIYLYDFNFKLQNTINIFNNLIIHSVFKNPAKNEILLYCPDNQAFVYINLKTNYQKTIRFTGALEQFGLANIYFWLKNEIIFLCGNKKKYKINTISLSLDELNETEVETVYPFFNKILNESSKYSLLSGDANSLIYKDTKKNELVYLNHLNNTKTVSKMPNSLGHQIIYLHDMFLSIHEKCMRAIKDGQEVVSINSASPFVFLRAGKKSESMNEFIVLRGSKLSTQDCFLTKYVITN